MRYLLNKEEIKVFNEAGIEVPASMISNKFGLPITSYSMDKLVANHTRTITSICEKIFNTTLEDWLSTKRQIKYRIYDFIDGVKEGDEYNPPLDIDFITGLNIQLQKKVLPKIKGVPTTVEYYEKCTIIENVATYENLILKIEFDFIYNALGFITNPNKVIKWYLIDGTESPNVKTMNSVLTMENDFDKMLKEGILRRQNIIDDIQFPILQMLDSIYPEKEPIENIATGRDFLNEMDSVFKGFIERSLTVVEEGDDTGKKVAYVEIRDYNGAHSGWLDTSVNDKTPRQYVMEALDI